MPYLPEALSVSLRFALWFLILPCLLMPRRLPFVDRLALGFSLMCAGAVVVAQGLSALHLYEPISLWGVTLVAGWLLLRRVSGLDLNRRWLEGLGQYEERGSQGGPGPWGLRLPWRNRTSVESRRPSPAAALVGLISAGVLIWTVWLRYAQALSSPVITASDGYLHMAWMKYIERVGGNHMFQDGIYPFGYHAVTSVLHFLSFQDPYTIFRYIGPIAGLLLVLSVGYAANAMRLRPAASLLAMAIIGLGFGSPLPYSPERMISPLPQEFAALFVLPGAVAAWRYLRDDDRIAGVMVLLATFLTGAIHPYSLIYLALAVSLIAVIGWASRAVPFTRVLRLALTAAAATVAAVLPLGIGALLGLPWHRSLGYVAENVVSLPPAAGLARIWTGNPLLNLGLLLSLGLLVAAAVRLFRGDRDRGPLLAALGLVLLALFTQAYGATGIPVLMDPARSGLFFALFLALAVAAAVDVLWPAGRRADVWQIAGVSVLILLQVGIWRPTAAQPLGQYEYAEAGNAYMAISKQFTPYLWTIVGPQEQYDQVLGVGQHIQAYNFALEHTAQQMGDPSFQLVDWPTPTGPAVIPTEDVFVFVEKQPLGSQATVTPDAAAAVPERLSSDQVYTLIYLVPEARGRLQARMWGLVEAYRAAHPDQVSLFHDDASLRVYHIHRKLPDRPR